MGGRGFKRKLQNAVAIYCDEKMGVGSGQGGEKQTLRRSQVWFWICEV